MMIEVHCVCGDLSVVTIEVSHATLFFLTRGLYFDFSGIFWGRLVYRERDWRGQDLR
jgi:hypothetical protein